VGISLHSTDRITQLSANQISVISANYEAFSSSNFSTNLFSFRPTIDDSILSTNYIPNIIA
jgi:hypothetical protein